MGTTNLDLYEVLKDKIGPEAARMVADSIPSGGQVATKDDIAALAVRLELAIEARVTKTEAYLMRWMLTFFVPLWLGVWGVILALVLTR